MKDDFDLKGFELAELFNKLSYSVNGAMIVVGSLALSEWLALGGFLMCIITYATNTYLQVRRARYEKEHATEVLLLKTRILELELKKDKE